MSPARAKNPFGRVPTPGVGAYNADAFDGRVLTRVPNPRALQLWPVQDRHP